MLAISDLFTQDAQFRWMLDCLAELWRLHPVEDELLQELLILGTAKAVAVVGCRAEPDTIDRLRKGVEAGLRSGQPSTRLAAVHALLYLLQRDTEGGGEGDTSTITERLSQINSYIEQLHAEHARTRENLAKVQTRTYNL